MYVDSLFTSQLAGLIHVILSLDVDIELKFGEGVVFIWDLDCVAK